MKTKIAIILFAAVTLLSFTLSSSKKTVRENSAQETNTTTGTGGFELQDRDQF
ncbi:MAG: hypothetical protein ACKO96_07330 [Flammeovirgaceae bacterium]